ncbi:hypothetical protein IAI53_01350 [Thauera sp. CAU 1555]|uniref:Helix-turn-helix domain-containing protein n=1 Tax=Thauera sedimentorum TaxID=2767595 RepID=A0ABR9B5J0_9RHOO|nr:hypothetical protein [Thauera sedimentorum]MBC9070603.1 hypothetical protein [Thauera sedimentorum]MBD8501522.1 hypothetical protein [Thauera sedimentorum]
MQTNTIQTTWRNDAPLTPESTYSTEQAAAILHIRPNTLRVALCRDGAYMGVHPIKRANRFLAWPANEIDALARGEVVK